MFKVIGNPEFVYALIGSHKSVEILNVISHMAEDKHENHFKHAYLYLTSSSASIVPENNYFNSPSEVKKALNFIFR